MIRVKEGRYIGDHVNMFRGWLKNGYTVIGRGWLRFW